MRKNFALQSAITTVFLLTSPFALANAQAGLTEDNLVVVTANRINQNVTDILADVEIIQRQDIERLQPQSLIDLLTNISGVDFVQRGGHAQDASIFIRGANSNQVLILIDGVRVGSATLGAKSVANIPVVQIERVEIVKGPRAALWGSDAIGGVIQIFTRRYQSGEHRVAITVGSHDTNEVEAAIGFGNEQLNNTVTYGRKRSDGFDVRVDSELDEDGYENDSLAIRGSYQANTHNTFDWVAQADKGENEFDTSFGGNVSHYTNQLWNLRYTHTVNDWNHQLSLKNSRDHSYSIGNGVLREDANSFETRREQYSFLTRRTISNKLSLTGVLEWLNDDIGRSTNNYNETNRTSKSAQFGVNYIGERFLTDIAVRYDDVQRVKSLTSFNFGGGVRITSNDLVSLNFSEGFKAPTFNDLYFPFGGNPNLKFETSENIELLYKGNILKGYLTASVYNSTIENLIQWMPDSNGIWSPNNVGKAEVSGVDLSYALKHGDYSHKLTASYIDAENAVTGQQLARRAKKHFGYEFGFVGNALNWFIQLQHVGERPDTDFQTFMPTMLDSYTRANLGIGYEFDTQWKLQLKINDAFDEAPTSVSGYNPVEREFYLTVSHQNLF